MGDPTNSTDPTKNSLIFIALALAFSMVVLGYVVVNSAMTPSHQFVAVIILAGVVISVSWSGVSIVQKSNETAPGRKRSASSNEEPQIMIDREAMKDLINEVLNERDKQDKKDNG
ncbi:hypothetical protein KQI52_00780 [bacterium]|nr:hypothetical protein [bacterium]